MNEIHVHGSSDNVCPLVSIVIPAFNAEKYLREAIDSVLAQAYPNIELIVLDDGSTDGTSDILRSYPENLFYWEGHANMGQSATLNKGWQMSKGDILSYLSADDVLLPKAVEVSVAELLADRGLVLVYCDYMLFDEHGIDIKPVTVDEYRYDEMVSRLVVPPGPGPFFLRSAYESTGGWNTLLRQIPDFDFWLRLGLVGKGQRVPVQLAKYRVHTDSQTYAEANIEKSEEYVRVMNDFFGRTDLTSDVMKLKRESMAYANLMSARMHLRAGRYAYASRHLVRAMTGFPLSVCSMWAMRLIGNGILYRVSRLKHLLSERS